jgi:hypothetical protein
MSLLKFSDIFKYECVLEKIWLFQNTPENIKKHSFVYLTFQAKELDNLIQVHINEIFLKLNELEIIKESHVYPTKISKILINKKITWIESRYILEV